MWCQWALLWTRVSNLQLDLKYMRTIPHNAFGMSYSCDSQAINLHIYSIHINNIITARYMKGFDKIIWQLFYQKSKLSKEFHFSLSEINRLTYHKDLFITFSVNTTATKCCLLQSKIIAIPISTMLANKMQIKADLPEASEGIGIPFHLHPYLSSNPPIVTSPFCSYKVFSFNISILVYCHLQSLVNRVIT